MAPTMGITDVGVLYSISPHIGFALSKQLTNKSTYGLIVNRALKSHWAELPDGEGGSLQGDGPNARYYLCLRLDRVGGGQ